jgi:hypothetical protein
VSKYALLHFVLVAWLSSAAQNPNVSGRSLSIPMIKAEITVDGRLEEPVWQAITPVTDFIQTWPNLGEPISERTEARLFYDENNLYVGFRCYDREPRKIVRRMGPHDALDGSDSVSFFIDPFHDHRTGYYFAVSAAGGQFDAISNEDNTNSDESVRNGAGRQR